ncbi:MAG: carbohydrate kinase family protein [Anaerovoracaceae bacterium]|jgi:sugar/nucleoside kinase (ribokinase family)
MNHAAQPRPALRSAAVRAAVAGALSVDICPRFVCPPAREIGDVIRPGEITRITGREIHPGGPVANTGLALHRFGIEPVLCARLGDDDFGRLLRHMLRDGAGERALTGLISDPASYTAWSVILAVPGLDRSILQNPGANDRFRADDLDWNSLRDCGLLHFGHPSTMREIYRDGGEGLYRALRGAREHGLLTSLDLCAVDPASEAGRQDWRAILRRVLPWTDFFVPSIDELTAILPPQETDADTTAVRRRAARLAALAQEYGAANVLIKCGAAGMAYRHAGAGFFAAAEQRLRLPAGCLQSWAGQTGFRTAVPVTKEVSGLGAGDTSIAAYLAALLRGCDLTRALTLAVTEGALCVTEVSAVGGLRPFEEVLCRPPESL